MKKSDGEKMLDILLSQKCDWCGKLKLDVSLRIDPFTLEINDRIVERNFCDDCIQNRRDDI